MDVCDAFIFLAANEELHWHAHAVHTIKVNCFWHSNTTIHTMSRVWCRSCLWPSSFQAWSFICINLYFPLCWQPFVSAEHCAERRAWQLRRYSLSENRQDRQPHLSLCEPIMTHNLHVTSTKQLELNNSTFFPLLCFKQLAFHKTNQIFSACEKRKEE